MKKFHEYRLEESTPGSMDRFLDKAIILEPGEYVCRDVQCPLCNGEKHVPARSSGDGRMSYITICPRCNGTGVVPMAVKPEEANPERVG